MKEKIKATIFFVTTICIVLTIIEVLSLISLLTVLKNDSKQSLLLQNIPAQLRLSSQEILSDFPGSMPLKRVGKYMSFPFDPVLGFRKDDLDHTYGQKIDTFKDKFVILTFGGSTTVADNWPKYLKEIAQRKGIDQDIAVFNAGLWGYMTFNEKVYFSSWILPELAENGIVPDLVISFDGVNDVWSRVLSYYYSKDDNDAVWLKEYHGYHQQLDAEMRSLGRTSTGFKNLVSNLAASAYRFALKTYGRIYPYTIKALMELAAGTIQSSPEKKKLSQKNMDARELPGDVENQIVASFKNSLVDFMGLADIRNIRFVAYLQPVLLDRYVSAKTPDTFYFPDFNYEGMNLFRENRFFSDLNGNFVVKTEVLYEKIEKMYGNLNRDYNGRFVSAADLFKTVKNLGQVYKKDAVHYMPGGSKMIAEFIIQDLVGKGILTTSGGQSMSSDVKEP